MYARLVMDSKEECKKLCFKVKCEQILPPSAVMAITGNVDELGNWDPERTLPMECISKTGDGEIWFKEVALSHVSNKIKFRYAMIEVIEEKNHRLVKILKWETHLKPRSFYRHEATSGSEPELHTFGKIGDKMKLQRGWLTGQTEVHLRVYGDSFKWFKPRHRGRRAYLKVHQLRMVEEPNDLVEEPNGLIGASGVGGEEDSLFGIDEETCDGVHCEPCIDLATVTRLGEDAEPRVPDSSRFQGAIQHTERDYHTFRMQTRNLDTICIEVDVLVGSRLDREKEEEPKLVGTARVPPFERLQGIKWLHVYGNNRRVIGQVRIDFLVILPLRDQIQLMDVSYVKYWRFIRTLTFGHRGSGSDIDHDVESALKENTLSSLRSAFEHGADYVEFDVHLSKDKIPMIYHDYFVALTLRKKRRGDLRYVKVAVKDLTRDELQNLKVKHTAVLNKDHCLENMDAEQSDHLDSLVFLTLAQILDHFDQDDNKIGFNIEIKYPLPLASGEHELENYFERNEFLDVILKLILRMAGRRRILLSSFDPDICTMINLKQNKYPVVLLSQGINSVYDDYQDLRTRSHTMAIHHAVDADLLGVNLFCEEVCQNPNELLTLARSMNLVFIVWGDELNKESMQKSLKALNVDGLVFDRIHEHHQKGHLNVFRSTSRSSSSKKNWPTAEVLSGLGFDSLTSMESTSEPLTSVYSEDSDVSSSKQAKIVS